MNSSDESAERVPLRTSHRCAFELGFTNNFFPDDLAFQATPSTLSVSLPTPSARLRGILDEIRKTKVVCSFFARPPTSFARFRGTFGCR